MSIEQSLQNIADALLKVADAINSETAGANRKLSMMNQIHIQEAMAAGRELAEMKAATRAEDTIEQDVTQVETDAKAAQQKAMDKVSTGKAEIAAALEKAKAEKEAAKPAPVVEEDPLDAAPLDWDKDVRPALLAVGKDRDALVKLMAKYEVPKGGKAPVEKWADLLAEANDIVAARG